MNKIKLTLVIFTTLIVGIIAGYAISKSQQSKPKEYKYTGDNSLVLGTYQDFVDTTVELLNVIEEAAINDISFLTIQKESDVYKEYQWLLDIIIKNNYQYIKTDNEILEDYYNYYYAVETLCDSLFEWQTDYWLDIVQETDVYYTYEMCRNELR